MTNNDMKEKMDNRQSLITQHKTLEKKGTINQFNSSKQPTKKGLLLSNIMMQKAQKQSFN